MSGTTQHNRGHAPSPWWELAGYHYQFWDDTGAAGNALDTATG
ncbi:MAG TPA: hypothetical protein VMB73_08990 [Acetobacteraceae bacterium]|jgi:hypothetical protein|nr:hypothetical protein [Acetobacteraceae bacterium]